MVLSLARSLAAARWAAHGLRIALSTPPPRRREINERLAAIPRSGLPLAARVTIHWDQHHVPFIEAEHDVDLATALGVVHAHLRLAQLEFLRRVSRGRLAEMLGRLALPLDHALRTLDFGRAVPAIVEMLPEETRRWLEGFVAGINHYLAQIEALPPEFALLGMGREPWTIEDVLTIGRLAAVDVTWLVWFRLLGLRRVPEWAELWRRLIESSISLTPKIDAEDREQAALATALLAAARSGSNAVAIAAERSTTGAALLAADPHISLVQPSLWLIAAYRSPSYQAAGLMIPGLPFIAIGRNPWISWAGTNLHAASSELVDVSALPPAAFRERRERIDLRWSRPRDVTIRETEFGPVISDTPQLHRASSETLALRWLGHRPSDETTAMLAVNRARDWDEFRAAFEGYAVPGLSMICATRGGRIGQLVAAHLPARKLALPSTPFMRPDELAAWQRIVTARDLPVNLDPPKGYIASANERPRRAELLYGLFFSPDDRWRRLSELIERKERLAPEDAMELQRDVYHAPSAALLARLEVLLGDEAARWRAGSAVRRLAAALQSWDGRYDATSAGALAYELLLYHFVSALVPAKRRQVYEAGWCTRTLLAAEIATAPEAVLRAALRRALPRAARGFLRYGCWGALHGVRLAHPLAATPWLGRRYRYGEFPASGSSETLLKTAHSLTDQPHAASYGSSARFVCDLATTERSHAVILGGQDGWPGSSTALDQVSLWRRGGYVTVSLTPEDARGRASHRTELTPASSGG